MGESATGVSAGRAELMTARREPHSGHPSFCGWLRVEGWAPGEDGGLRL